MTLLVRRPGREEAAAIDRVLRLAFDGPAEAMLVRSLHAAGDVIVELVAEDPTGSIAGCVQLSSLCIEGGPTGLCAAALAPLAVVPARQGEGMGSALARAALNAAADSGIGAVFVLGDPAYYCRFGFTADAARPFEAPFGPPHFMALALKEGALAGASGRIIYPPAFGLPN